MLEAAEEHTEDIGGHWFYNLPVLVPLIMSGALHTFSDMKRSGKSLVTAASSGNNQLRSELQTSATTLTNGLNVI